MPVTIRFQGGKLAGQVKHFPDDVEIITIGRNPERCQVIFPPDETHVGREHCALKRSLGRYRLILNGEDRVMVNGREGYHEEELPASADLRLGPAGPQIVVTTSDSSGLPPTVARGAHQPGMGTLLERDKKRSKRGILVALLALVAVAIAADVGYHLHKRTAADVQQTQSNVQQTQSDLQQTKSDIDKTSLELAKMAPDIAEHLREIKNSVYLVVIKTFGENEASFGTAWVVADGTLATNSHIAEAFAREMSPLDVMIVRSPTNPPQDFVVTAVTVHPGYHDFDKLIGARIPCDSDGRQIAAIPACDVALLTVNGVGLAPPIPLASADQIKSLKTGDVIGMVGYPSENVSGHNTSNPEPSSQVARIARQTDFLMRTDSPIDDTQLIHHSLPETGGASGSPIVNADGKVIAINSAANFIGVGNDSRVPMAIGLNFAQRADLVQELLDHRADTAQAARDQRWLNELNDYFIGASAEDDQRSQDVNDWLANNAGNQASEITRAHLIMKSPHVYKTFSATTDVQIPSAGTYYFHYFNQYAHATHVEISKSGAAEAFGVSDHSHGSLTYTFDEPSTVTCTISAPKNDNETSEVDLVVYRLDPKPTP
jgi:hypothetical protein